MSPPIFTRRKLLLGTAAVAGGGLILSLAGEDADQASLASQPGTLEPNAFLQLTPDGTIVLQIDRAEMGQGVITGLVTLVAEELGVRPDQITPRQAPVHPLFQDPTQLTGESRSMRARWVKSREVAAKAREMLRAAAAEQWGVAINDVKVRGGGYLTHPRDGFGHPYHAFVEAASKLPVPGKVELKTPDRYAYIGTRVPRPDIPAKVTGEAVFGLDVQLPGLKTAVVHRAPRPGDRLKSFDASAAEKMPGVQGIFQIPTGVAVVADDFWSAKKASEAIKAEWQDGPMTGWTVDRVFAGQRERLDTEEGAEARDDGDVAEAFDNAASEETFEYTTPYLAHATMEPMNATVKLSKDRCDIWAPMQGPDVARQVAVQITGLPREQIHMHTTFLGGGFGRRAMNDYVAEAVQIAQQAKVPVKLVWTREDDMRFDWYRSATSHRIRVGFDDNGNVTAWHHRLVAPLLSLNLMHDWLQTMMPEWVPTGVASGTAELAIKVQESFFGPFQAWEGSATLPYKIDNVRVDTIGWNPPVPVGIWRSVGNSYNAFVVESLIDELARRAGKDPIEFRRGLLTDHPRHLAVLDELEQMSGWPNAKQGRALGVAIHESFGSVVGQVAEVSIDDDKNIRVHKVWCAVECGTAINPDIVAQQMESGIIYGLTAALYGQIDIDDGKIRQSNFHDYRMMRLQDSPEIETRVIKSTDDPGGIGEAGLPPTAAAVENALMAASGQRLRAMPLRL